MQPVLTMGRSRAVVIGITLVVLAIGAAATAGFSGAEGRSAELDRAATKLAVLRQTATRADLFPSGGPWPVVKGLRSVRRVGPATVAGQRFYVGYDPKGDELCLVTFSRPNRELRSVSRGCGPVSQLVNEVDWSQSAGVVVGLAPDHAKCVVVSVPRRWARGVPVVRNAYAARVPGSVKKVAFRRSSRRCEGRS